MVSSNEAQMAAYLVQHGPLAIAADAVEWFERFSTFSFFPFILFYFIFFSHGLFGILFCSVRSNHCFTSRQFYTGGVFDLPCGTVCTFCSFLLFGQEINCWTESRSWNPHRWLWKSDDHPRRKAVLDSQGFSLSLPVG